MQSKFWFTGQLRTRNTKHYHATATTTTTTTTTIPLLKLLVIKQQQILLVLLLETQQNCSLLTIPCCLSQCRLYGNWKSVCCLHSRLPACRSDDIL